MDQSRTIRVIGKAAVRSGGHRQIQLLLRADRRGECGERGADASDRPALSEVAVLRVTPDETCPGGALRNVCEPHTHPSGNCLHFLPHAVLSALSADRAHSRAHRSRTRLPQLLAFLRSTTTPQIATRSTPQACVWIPTDRDSPSDHRRHFRIRKRSGGCNRIIGRNHGYRRTALVCDLHMERQITLGQMNMEARTIGWCRRRTGGTAVNVRPMK